MYTPSHFRVNIILGKFSLAMILDFCYLSLVLTDGLAQPRDPFLAQDARCRSVCDSLGHWVGVAHLHVNRG